MSEDYRTEDEQVEHASDELEDLLDGMGERITDTVESIADLGDEVEELNGEIESLLKDLRTVQSKIGQKDKDKLEPLIDQLETVSKQLQNALWTMDFTSEDLLDDTELWEIFEWQVDSPD
ncbi:MAG: hypothetical protein ACYSYV_03760 [Planctomycetota bacterium]|jgi:ABC-type transporter Mla subunit MlaD